MVVGCKDGFGLNTGEDCESWSHMCSSWYLPMLQLRGVLNADKHSLLYCTGLAVDFLMHNVKLVRIQWMSCCSTMEVYWGGGFLMFLNPFSQRPARLPYV